MNTSTYPVKVNAQLDTKLSRGLWLVKWLLAIPHYVILAFLWLAFFVLSVIAFFAILFTGRYPRGIFDFNVGVMRWTWRVGYYAYSALGTDRYPPFTCRTSRTIRPTLRSTIPSTCRAGLVLVKWWLLAIPHYLIISFFFGGGLYVVSEVATADQAPVWVWRSGLVGLLVFFAAIVLLFTGRYPQSMYNFVLGMNRWVWRVSAYVGLMTDQYPPFRLDQGGQEPEGGQPIMPSTPQQLSQEPPPSVAAPDQASVPA